MLILLVNDLTSRPVRGAKSPLALELWQSVTDNTALQTVAATASAGLSEHVQPPRLKKKQNLSTVSGQP